MELLYLSIYMFYVYIFIINWQVNIPVPWIYGPLLVLNEVMGLTGVTDRYKWSCIPGTNPWPPSLFQHLSTAWPRRKGRELRKVRMKQQSLSQQGFFPVSLSKPLLNPGCLGYIGDHEPFSGSMLIFGGGDEAHLLSNHKKESVFLLLIS